MRSAVVLFTSVLSLFSVAAVNAAPIEMRVLPAIDAQNSGNLCPGKVTLTETLRPYREGGYTRDGSANLSAIAEKMTIASTDDFSVTWVGTLKPTYGKCKATAGISRIGNEDYQGDSYLRLRFVKGKVYLILDVTGNRDANNLTTVILQRSVRNGNPNWTWGGTD